MDQAGRNSVNIGGGVESVTKEKSKEEARDLGPFCSRFCQDSFRRALRGSGRSNLYYKPLAGKEKAQDRGTRRVGRKKKKLDVKCRREPATKGMYTTAWIESAIANRNCNSAFLQYYATADSNLTLNNREYNIAVLGSGGVGKSALTGTCCCSSLA